MIDGVQKRDFKKDSFSFDVDSQIIGELGERLVTRNHIGIAELIKNAYDADSCSVELAFSNVTLNKGDSELVISDAGTGMTFDVVKNHWMMIGTSHKREQPVSEIYGRPRTGNKGIGRFACQKLARHLRIETCAKNGNNYEHTTVNFDWEDFVPGKRLSTVKCNYEFYQSTTGDVGTKLILTGLREKLTSRDFQMLLKNVSLISVASPVRRKGKVEDPGFNIKITAPEFKDLLKSEGSVEIGDKILTSGWGTLTGRYNGSNLRFELDHKDSKTKYFELDNEDFASLNGVEFKIHIIPLKNRGENENRRNTKLLTNEKIKQIRDDYAGIRLYLNAFRIYPYGDLDAGDDWLGIAADISRRRGGSAFIELDGIAKSLGIQNPARAMLNHPGTRSLIGEVILQGGAVSAFQVKADREGLVETETFSKLKQSIRMALDWTTLHYEAWLHEVKRRAFQEKKASFEKSIGESFDTDITRIKRAVETLSDTSDDPQSETSLRIESNATPKISSNDKNLKAESFVNVTTRAREYLLTHFEQLEAEVDTLRSVAATAPLLFVFAHEVKGISGALLGYSVKLEQLAGAATDNSIKEELLRMANDAMERKQSFDDLFGLFDVFSDSANFYKRTTSFSNLLSRVKAGLQFFAKEFNISLDFPKISPTWRIPKLNEAEAYSIAVNLLSNSIKALIASNVIKRVIRLEVNQIDSGYEFVVKDNGVGLAKQYWDTVFEPFTFDPENKLYSSLSSKIDHSKLSTLGKGSGLGLHIVKNIITKHNGSVSFCKPDENWSAVVKVSLRR